MTKTGNIKKNLCYYLDVFNAKFQVQSVFWKYAKDILTINNNAPERFKR